MTRWQPKFPFRRPECPKLYTQSPSLLTLIFIFCRAVLEGPGLTFTMKAMGHGSPEIMMRHQRSEYVEAEKRVINRRNESSNGSGYPDHQK